MRRAHADSLLAASGERILGYAAVFYRAGARVARLYSIAVDPASRGIGAGALLLDTQFDWRIGVLNGQPIFACKYRMARHHWQVIKHQDNGAVRMGSSDTIAIDQAPAAVIAMAVKAAGLIGNGLYGVDIKETPRGVFVIEVNDNPNIEHGVEDLVLKDELYRMILRDLLRRIDEPAGVRAAPDRRPALSVVRRQLAASTE